MDYLQKILNHDTVQLCANILMNIVLDGVDGVQFVLESGICPVFLDILQGGTFCEKKAVFDVFCNIIREASTSQLQAFMNDQVLITICEILPSISNEFERENFHNALERILEAILLMKSETSFSLDESAHEELTSLAESSFDDGIRNFLKQLDSVSPQPFA